MAQDVRSRIHGSLLALACGDALGAPLEFLTMAQARHQFGWVSEMVGGGQFNWQPGECTDDTAMTLAVARGILEVPRDPVDAIGAHFVRWAGSATDVGATVAAAIACFRSGTSWPEAARRTPQAELGRAAGNGSLMRTLPVALAYGTRASMLTTSAQVSAMTHWDPQAEVCCAIYCLWVAELLDGTAMGDAWNHALILAKAHAQRPGQMLATPGPAPLPADFWRRLEGVHALNYDGLQPSGYAGYVVEALEAAAWCCLNARDIEETLILAVNLAGEADTIGAIAGGAAGACYGEERVPRRWLDRLLMRNEVQKVADQLADLRAHQLINP